MNQIVAFSSLSDWQKCLNIVELKENVAEQGLPAQELEEREHANNEMWFTGGYMHEVCLYACIIFTETQFCFVLKYNVCIYMHMHLICFNLKW